MAASVAQGNKKDVIVTRVPCTGSGREIKNGERGTHRGGYYSGGTKYPCAECKGYYAKVKKRLPGKDTNNKPLYEKFANDKVKYVLNTHTRKIEEAKPFTQCAECNANIYTVDFLCELCRDSEDSF